jgi:hypothetical protein
MRTPVPVIPDLPPVAVAVQETAPPVDAIPDFLKRAPAAEKAEEAAIAQYEVDQSNLVDEAAKASILAEQAEMKKKKAAARAGKMKAKKSGDLKKMPLEGKAALAVINS